MGRVVGGDATLVDGPGRSPRGLLSRLDPMVRRSTRAAASGGHQSLGGLVGHLPRSRPARRYSRDLFLALPAQPLGPLRHRGGRIWPPKARNTHCRTPSGARRVRLSRGADSRPPSRDRESRRAPLVQRRTFRLAPVGARRVTLTACGARTSIQHRPPRLPQSPGASPRARGHR